MQEELVTFQVAKLAREKGFNPPLDVYNDVFDLEDGQPMFNVHRDTLLSSKNTWILRPTQSLLQKWLREVHNIIVYVNPFKDIGDDVNDPIRFKVFNTKKTNSMEYKTYEEALEIGLQESLKLISYDNRRNY